MCVGVMCVAKHVRMLQFGFNTTKVLNGYEITTPYWNVFVCGKTLSTQRLRGTISPSFDMSFGKERTRHLPDRFLMFLC